MKLVALFATPSPYTTTVLNALAETLDLHVVYLSHEDRVSGFDDSLGVEPAFEYSVHWSKLLHAPSTDLQVEFSVGVARRVRRLAPDAILVSSWKPAMIEPVLWSRWSGSTAVMWGESTRMSGLVRGGTSNRVRRLYVRAVDAYVTNGTQATAYLRDLGVSADQIVTSCLPAAQMPSGPDLAHRTPGDPVRFLFVGRLISRKRPLEVIEAFAVVRNALPLATLTVVGGGELEPEVRQAAARVAGVEFIGRREGDELAAVYANADVLVLPALREVWGLVVNEALSHGLYVVASDQVGSAHDLLDAETGVMLPADRLELLPGALVEAGRTVDVGDDARVRRAAAVADSTPARFARDIHRALDIGVRSREARRRRPRGGRSASARRSRRS
jgi:glycosyltransferase involved in cell wall biosynthesis